MTHLELNHIKDDKQDAERAHKGQEAVKMVNAGLQPEYKGRFKLQVQPHCPALGVLKQVRSTNAPSIIGKHSTSCS